MEPYRWSPEVEARVVALLRAGCNATVICEQVRCSERTARRLVDRWKSGQSLSQTIGDKPLALTGARRPGARWVADFSTLSMAERAAYRAGIYERADAGWPLERIADRFKMRVAIVRRILAERDGAEFVDEEPPIRLAPPAAPWPQITASHEDWPADQRFEDCPKAARADRGGEVINGLSHVYRYTRNALDRQSYCSNASAWAAL